MSPRGWLGCPIRPLDGKKISPATFLKAPVALRRPLISHAGLYHLEDFLQEANNKAYGIIMSVCLM